MRLKDKVAIVTGIGAGIGEAIAIRFAEEGARLVLVDMHASTGQATLDRVSSMGATGIFVQADISREEDARRITERAIASFSGIDIVVNNAADFTQKGVEQADIADWQKVLGVNVIGTAMVSKFAIPFMKAKGGSIVNMGSQSGVMAQAEFATYNASKGAVIMLTKCMALDLAPYKIRVNSVNPGCILTSASYREIERLGMTFEQWRDKCAPMHMLNRLGEPREVANAVLFLASDEASFITAASLMVEGGSTEF